MKKLLVKFLRNVRDNGLPYTIRKSGAYLGSIISFKSVYRIYCIDLKNWEPVPDEILPFRFVLMDKESADSGYIRQIESMEEWLEGLTGKILERGGICLLALDGETIAGFNLVSFGKVYMPLARFTRQFRAGEAWSEQISVRKTFRGGGLATALRRRMFRELKSRGIRKFYGGTLVENNKNRGLSQKVGFREIIDIEYSSRFGVRNWHFRRLKEARP